LVEHHIEVESSVLARCYYRLSAS